MQSASLELNQDAEIISYEEYHPYGTTAYQASNGDIKATAKRYRYTGKERDEESGLYYHGARYYVLWLCRWCSADPKESERAGLSPYDYCSNNPINRVDPDGMKDGDPKTVYTVPSAASTRDNTGRVPIRPVDASNATFGEARTFPLSPVQNAESRDGALLNTGKKVEKKIRADKDIPEVRKELAVKAQDLDRQSFVGDGVTSKREIARAQYEANEAYGSMVRNGGLGVGIGYAVGGQEGAWKGSVVDGVAMSLVGRGTPYGKIELTGAIEIENLPLTEAKRNPNQEVGDFISSHAYTRHKFNPSSPSVRNKTQYGENINVSDVRLRTLNDPDNIVPKYDNDGVNYANVYQKKFGFNISTNATPTNESRVIINLSNPEKSSQFPKFNNKIYINGYK